MSSHIKSLVRIEQTMTVVAAGAGSTWSGEYSLDLSDELREVGRLVNVKVRMTVPSNITATGLVCFLVEDTTLAAQPDDLNIFYESDSVNPTEHATNADIDDDMWPIGGCYVKPQGGTLLFGCNFTASGAGNLVLAVQIIAEVWR